MLSPLLGPLVARAQLAGKMWRIGYLGPSPETAPLLLKAFLAGLEDLGYVEGRNIVVEYRWTNAGTRMNDDGVLLAHARDLVAHKVDVMAASIDPAIRAASQATNAVPIVMLNVSDPIELGLVKTLGRPGGNITGMTRLSPDLIGRNLQTLREVVPKASRMALLMSASNTMSRSIVGQAQQPAINMISADELKTKMANNQPVVIVDVRSPEGFANSTTTVKGSIHFKLRKLKYRLQYPPFKNLPRNSEIPIARSFS